jgi:hypothetical protein
MIGPGPWSVSTAKLQAILAAQGPAPVSEAPPQEPMPVLGEEAAARCYREGWQQRWESID